MTAARTYTPKSRITDIVWKPLIMLAVVAAAFGLFAVCAEVFRRHRERQILAAVAGVGGASLSQANRQRFSTIDSEDLSVEGISPFLQSCFLYVRVMGFLQNRRFHLEINLFFY